MTKPVTIITEHVITTPKPVFGYLYTLWGICTLGWSPYNYGMQNPVNMVDPRAIVADWRFVFEEYTNVTNPAANPNDRF